MTGAWSARLARLPPQTSSPATWASSLFALYVLFQRFAVPGLPVSMLLVITLVWAALAVQRGVMVIEPARTGLWLLAVGATASVSVLQSALGHAPVASISSWALLVVTWMPLILRFRGESREEFLRFLVQVSMICTVLAVLAILMTLSQSVGLPYGDIFGQLPSSVIQSGFNTNSPLSYGSSLYKSNAWIALEPSLLSLELAVGFVAALLTSRRILIQLVLLGGLICTYSGSGLILVGVAVLVILVSRARACLAKLGFPALVAFVILLLTPVGDTFLGRADEFSAPGSSGSIRAVEPYQWMFPIWVERLDGVLLGFGPGSSQFLIGTPGIDGLIVTVPMKIFFDYGIVAGLVLAFFMVSCQLSAPSVALSAAMFIAYWSIQPAATLILLIGQIGMFCAFWAPTTHGTIEGRRAKMTKDDILHEGRPVTPITVGYSR